MNLSKMLELTIASREDTTKTVELEELIKRYIAEEEAKKKGTFNAFKSIKKYIDKTIKNQAHRPQIHGVKIVNDKMIFTNTYSAFRFNNIIEGLPIVEDMPDIDTIINNARDNNKTRVNTPNIKELKAQLKTAKANKKATKSKSILDVKEGFYKINNGYLNIELLIEVIEILGTKDLEIYTTDNWLSPIYTVSPEGEAVLLPCRINEEIKEEIEKDIAS